MHKNWQEIENLFLEIPNYNCFVCSPIHASGFRLKFYYDPHEKVVVSPVAPAKEDMAGFPRVLHGGFQAMLLDEIMYWAVQHFHLKIPVTASCDVEYLKVVPTGVPLLLKAKVLRALRGRTFDVESWIEKDKDILVRAKGRYVVPRLEDFKRLTGLTDIPQKFLSYL